MANVIKPSLKPVGGNVQIKTYGFNDKPAAFTEANMMHEVKAANETILPNYDDFEATPINPKLRDVLTEQEGKVESLLSQYHIFEDVEEQTPNRNPRPGDPDFVGPIPKEEPKKEEPKKEESKKEEPKKEESKKEEPEKEESKKEEPEKEENPKEEPKKEEKPKEDKPQQDNTVGNGKTTEIPDGVRQSGIIANYTQNYNTRGWGYDQGKLANAYRAAGSQTDGNMATIDGRYLVAVSPRFGKVGDNIDIQLENGKVIHAVIADVKGSDATSSWGHELGGKVDVVEWEINGTSQAELNRNLQDKGWYGSKVESITNTGSGNYF